MKILTVIGARPQFVKAAAVSRAVQKFSGGTAASRDLCEVIVHTGQHFDAAMSEIFFTQLGIPQPAYNLGIAGLSHAAMTGRMLEAVAAVIESENPDLLLVYGDTNSTLAGALAAAKLQVPIAHVEAGLRSFNRAMPEEINRVLTDHLSGMLFCPTTAAVRNLEAEGIRNGVFQVGDVMFDAALMFADIAREHSDILLRTGMQPGGYCLATVHRAENTDSPERLKAVLLAFAELAKTLPLALPLHPRTRNAVERCGLKEMLADLIILEPVSFLDMICLEKNARLILTDSGGVQKEAYFHRVPCITLRAETEWIETVQAGWNQLAGADTYAIMNAVRNARPGGSIPDYGKGHAAQDIVNIIVGNGCCRDVTGKTFCMTQ